LGICCLVTLVPLFVGGEEVIYTVLAARPFWASHIGWLLLGFGTHSLISHRAELAARISLIFLCAAAVVLHAVYSGIIRFTGEGFSAQVFFHWNVESARVAFETFPVLFLAGGAALLASVIGLYFLLGRAKLVRVSVGQSLGLMAAGLLLFGLAGKRPYPLIPLKAFLYEYWQFSLAKNPAESGAASPELLNAFGVRFNAKPIEELVVTAPKHPKNLVIVFLESFDYRYTAMGNTRHPSLTPQLDVLMKKGTALTNFWSPEGFTVAGIMSAFTGHMPDLHTNADILENQGMYKSLPAFSDILQRAGYHQAFMGGARSKYAGKAAFLESHGIDEVLGWEHWQKDARYANRRSPWGLHDTDLFAEALAKIETLRKQPPFHLSVLTLDTHEPGYPSPDAPRYGTHVLLDAIHSTDHALGKFANELERRGVLRDTVLFVTSDHVAFTNPIHRELFGEETDRKIVGVFLSPDSEGGQPVERAASTPDIAPTVLDLLKVKSNHEFIFGRSIYDHQRPRPFMITGHSRSNRYRILETSERLPGRMSQTTHPADGRDGAVETLTTAAERYAVRFQRPPRGVPQSIRIVSSGLSSGNRASIILDGRDEFDVVGGGVNTVDALESVRGFLAVGLDSRGRVMARGRFDTSQSAAQSDRLAEFLERLTADHVLLLAVKGDGNAMLSGRARKALKRAGARQLDKFETGSSYFLATRVGKPALPGWEQVRTNGEAISATFGPPEIRALRRGHAPWFSGWFSGSLGVRSPAFVAHAGGGIKGRSYTNSLEALDENYRRGFRFFELDFNWTSDNQLVCIHDWESRRPDAADV
jgi:arylsulfatase A-like enzyme